ncbi:MAG: glycerate kinase [Firmicutes bacterium]|nr:glycerate kinase [Bacillota bacterium]
MKIVIAIDSFKGSMTSMEAGAAVRDAVMNICNGVQAVLKPVADGGEGMTEALTYGLGGSFVYTDVTGPLGDPVRARYGILPDKATAVMEMAEAAGIMLVKEKDPWNASTYGVGEMIIDAVSRGIRTFIMGIGGSATTDGGTGMLKALGIKFLDETGNEISEGAGDLDRIAEIDTEGMLSELAECEFRVACDVKNPLYGENGAVYVFGPQKGVKESEKAILDAKMQHYASMTEKATGADHSCDEGAGAAGGLGFAFSSFFPNAKLQSGIKIALQAIELEAEMTDADLVITGEGRLDGQTAMGKVPVGIAKLAKKYDVPVIAFAGCIGDGAELCREEGIDDFFAITPEGMELETAMKKDVAENNMKKTVERELLLFMDKKGMKL